MVEIGPVASALETIPSRAVARLDLRSILGRVVPVDTAQVTASEVVEDRNHSLRGTDRFRIVSSASR